MPFYLLQHRHDPSQCGAAFAAWRGFESPLRRELVPSTCLTGGHALWWRVEAADAGEALSLLPRYVAERTQATEFREVQMP